MIRRITTSLSALSLLLGIAMVLFWVRSYRVGEMISYFRAVPAARQGLFYQVIFSRGVFLVGRDSETPDSQTGFELLTATQTIESGRFGASMGAASHAYPSQVGLFQQRSPR